MDRFTVRPREDGRRASYGACCGRCLPPKLHVGSGFIVSENCSSTQIDVLILHGDGPVLFRDGDFVIVTPDVVAGVIEVKSSVEHARFRESATKLNRIAGMLRAQPQYPAPFFGLFSLEPSEIRPTTLLATLKEVNGVIGNYEINCIALGPRRFVRFREFPPQGPKRRYSKWQAYDLNEIAYGYFIHNVLEHLFPEAFQNNQAVWYPVDGKESKKVAEISKNNEETGEE